MDPALVAWAELFELPVPQEEAQPDEPEKRGLFRRLREKIGATQPAISPQLAAIYAPKLISEDTWDDLEEALILADCGLEATERLIDHLRNEAREGRVTSGETLAQALWKQVAKEMAPEPARIPLDGEPTVILVIGVARSDALVLLVGAVGLFQWSPQIATYYLEPAIGTEVTVMIVGVLLLGVAGVFTKLYRRVRADSVADRSQ